MLKTDHGEIDHETRPSSSWPDTTVTGSESRILLPRIVTGGLTVSTELQRNPYAQTKAISPFKRLRSIPGLHIDISNSTAPMCQFNTSVPKSICELVGEARLELNNHELAERNGWNGRTSPTMLRQSQHVSPVSATSPGLAKYFYQKSPLGSPAMLSNGWRDLLYEQESDLRLRSRFSPSSSISADSRDCPSLEEALEICEIKLPHTMALLDQLNARATQDRLTSVNASFNIAQHVEQATTPVILQNELVEKDLNSSECHSLSVPQQKQQRFSQENVQAKRVSRSSDPRFDELMRKLVEMRPGRDPDSSEKGGSSQIFSGTRPRASSVQQKKQANSYKRLSLCQIPGGGSVPIELAGLVQQARRVRIPSCFEDKKDIVC